MISKNINSKLFFKITQIWIYTYRSNMVKHNDWQQLFSKIKQTKKVMIDKNSYEKKINHEQYHQRKWYF